MFWARLALLAGVTGTTAWWFIRRWRVRVGREAFERHSLGCLFAAGRTTDCSVRLWGRATTSGRLQVELQLRQQGEQQPAQRFAFELEVHEQTDQTFVFDFPSDVPGADPLQPNTAYRCQLSTADGTTVGEARFETAPGAPEHTPERFAIAVMSCHLPFDDDGTRNPKADRLLGMVPRILERYDVKRVVMMGDQVYGDLPEVCSLLNKDYFQRVAPPGRATIFDCTREEVRALYQQRHRIFWSSEGAQAIQSHFACHMILDDHEVFDNFGSAPEHASQRFPLCQRRLRQLPLVI